MREFDLIIPCFNEARSLPALAQRVVDAARARQLRPEQFKLVLIENGSKDGSGEVLRELKASALGEWLELVYVPVNLGYGHGLMQGFKSSSARVIGVCHGDMQGDPGQAFAAFDVLLGQRSDRAVLVKGIRLGRSWRQALRSRVYELLARTALGVDCFEINAQPKVFRRELIERLANPPSDHTFDLYLVYIARKHGYYIREIDVSWGPRPHGTSSWAYSFSSRLETVVGFWRYIWFLRKTEGRL